MVLLGVEKISARYAEGEVDAVYVRVVHYGEVEDAVEDLSREEFSVRSGSQSHVYFGFPISILRIKYSKSVLFRGTCCHPKLLSHYVKPWTIPITRGEHLVDLLVRRERCGSVSSHSVRASGADEHCAVVNRT